MGLSVIGAAYPRTGTLSLKVALEMLGFGPCYHMVEVITRPGQAEKWLNVFDGRPDWDAIFGVFKATTDAPACFYWRELAAHYPDAKVILTERDPEQWYRSVQETVLNQAFDSNMPGALKTFFERIPAVHFQGREHDHDFMVGLYRGMLDDVKRTIAADRLLVYRAGEGWEPLCSFLGAAVPPQPYPRINEREQAQGVLKEAAESDNPVEVFQRAMGRGGNPPSST